MGRPMLLFASLLLSAILPFKSSAQTEDLMFHHLGTSDGLSNDSVTAVLRDSRGFLWACTVSGINRYDGYSFRTYTKNNSDILADDHYWIVEDPNGNLWFRSRTGFSIYDSGKDSFSCDTRYHLDKLGIKADNAQAVGSTADGDFWVYGRGRIHLLEHGSGQVSIFAVSPSSYFNLYASPNYIYYIDSADSIVRLNRTSSEKKIIALPKEIITKPRFYIDRSDGIWVYEFEGERVFYLRNGSTDWKQIRFGDHSVAYNRLQCMLDAGNGELWIPTTHLGLVIYNYHTGGLRHYQHDQHRPHTLLSNNLSAICRDRDGLIWIGYFKNGLGWTSPSGQTIYSYVSHPVSDIGCFHESKDKSGFFYGTDSDGVMLHSFNGEEDKLISSEPNIILGLDSDSDGRLWLASFGNGIGCITDGSVRKWTTRNSGIADNNVYSITVTGDDTLWIGTLDGSVQRFTPSTGHFETVFSFNDNSEIRDSYFDGKTIYYATSTGLLIIDTKTISISRKSDIFRDNYVRVVFRDSRGLVWLGHSNGLSIWNPLDDSVSTLTHSDGLISDFITALAEDDYGRVWVGTGNGVSCITRNAPDRYTIMNVTDKDGLVSNTINDGAAYRLSNGNIVFGTAKGYSITVPRKQVEEAGIATVKLTEAIVDNSPVGFSPAEPGKTIFNSTLLTFPARYNSFSLSFSTLDMTFHNQIIYEFQLDNSESWIRMNDNCLRLTSLHHGMHHLRVRPVLNDGEIGQETSFGLLVKPRWWQSTAFKLICIIFFLGLSALVFRNLHYRTEQERKFRELEEENRKQKELVEMKATVFSNISHELRTPLSLIINPLENYLERNPQEMRSELPMVKKNADYLLELVNQLLDSHNASGLMTSSDIIYDDIVDELRNAFNAFKNIAEGRGINYTFLSNIETYPRSYDRNAIRKICNNILGNAFKFTPDGGSISLELSCGDNGVEMRFADTGRGISDFDKEHVLERFYQSSSNTPNDGGSGIGLHIVSECVRNMGGSISITDNTPTGSVFTVNLPQDTGDETASAPDGSPSVLLVDDNPEFLGFMAKCLSARYRILRAWNGSQALKILEDEDVDLVVSDVMMPVTDGLQLCTSIKNDIRFSHIPVILLTGKTGSDNELQGLSAGADDYLSKPFNMKILKARIENLIGNSIERRKLFTESIVIDPGSLSLTSLDKDFVMKAVHIVEENMDNPDFSVENLAEELCLSRSYFSRKFLKVTGKKPIDFIRSIRMKHGRQLLEESRRPVSEIAYMLGYRNPKLFSVHFREEFGMTPADFKREKQKDNQV